jgi:hypothetical protein
MRSPPQTVAVIVAQAALATVCAAFFISTFWVHPPRSVLALRLIAGGMAALCSIIAWVGMRRRTGRIDAGGTTNRVVAAMLASLPAFFACEIVAPHGGPTLLSTLAFLLTFMLSLYVFTVLIALLRGLVNKARPAL